MMRYKEQKSTDEGTTWTDTGITFNSKKAVAEYIDQATPSGVLDWRVGNYWVLRRDSTGVSPHFHIVKT
jgi:hypothetical protein